MPALAENGNERCKTGYRKRTCKGRFARLKSNYAKRADDFLALFRCILLIWSLCILISLTGFFWGGVKKRHRSLPCCPPD